MDLFARELAVARIVAAERHIEIDGEWWTVSDPPSRQHRLIATERASTVSTANLPTVASLELLLVERGVLRADYASRLAELSDDAEAAQIRLATVWGDDDAVLQTHAILRRIRGEAGALAALRDTLRPFAAETVRASTQMRCSVALSLRRPDGTPHWPEAHGGWTTPDPVLDLVLGSLAASRISEADLRELSQTDPWTAIWNTHNGNGNPFGHPPVDWSDEQRTLVFWADLYSRISVHPDAPAPSLLRDPDATDGWLLLQRRRTERERGLSRLDAIGSERIRRSPEIFLAARNPAEAATIQALNTAEAQHEFQNQMKILTSRKIMREYENPSTRERIVAAGVALPPPAPELHP